MLPDVDYKVVKTCKQIRKKLPNDRGTLEIYLEAGDRFHTTVFCTIIDKLKRR